MILLLYVHSSFFKPGLCHCMHVIRYMSPFNRISDIWGTIFWYRTKEQFWPQWFSNHIQHCPLIQTPFSIIHPLLNRAIPYLVWMTGPFANLPRGWTRFPDMKGLGMKFIRGRGSDWSLLFLISHYFLFFSRLWLFFRPVCFGNSGAIFPWNKGLEQKLL